MKAKKALRNTMFALLAIAFLIVNTQYHNIINWYELRPYSAEAKTCHEEATEKTEQKVIGLEYECGIEVASTIYTENPELAISLCEKHALSFIDKNLQKSLCKTEIEKKINEEKNSIIQSTNSFENKKYNYSLSLLPTETVAETNTSSDITITDEKSDFLIKINVLTPTAPHENLPLKEYVEHIAKLNKDNLDLSIQQSKPIGGISGYTLSIRNLFNDEKEEYVFTDNYPVHAFIFLEHNNLKYRFEIPESLGHRGGEILNSLEFK